MHSWDDLIHLITSCKVFDEVKHTPLVVKNASVTSHKPQLIKLVCCNSRTAAEEIHSYQLLYQKYNTQPYSTLLQQ